MLVFRNKCSRIFSQMVRLYTQGTNEALMENEKSFVLEPLNQRELIRVRGEEAYDFLQGLTTNDMKNLGRNSPDARLMYSMFLNKNGRVLYDAIIFSVPEPNTYLIECDKQISSDLRRLLRTYRVRRKIDIDAVYKDYKPWVAFDSNKKHNPSDIIERDASICALSDPRLSDLGMRIITQSDVNWNDLATHVRQNFQVKVNQAADNSSYADQRYRAGIPEGADEIPPGKYFPFETNGDLLRAISYNKGCFIGQELTARVHYTGVVRKRYMPVQLTAPVTSKKIIQTAAGAQVGTIVSSRGKNAIALVRLEKALKNMDFEIDGDPVYMRKPNWWPENIFGNHQAL